MNSEIKIVTYEDMSEMPEETLQKLAEKERDWYGYGMEGRGFGEYAICSDPDCRRVFSVEEIHPQIATDANGYIPLNELEKNRDELPCCPDCDSQIEFLLDPKYFPEYLRLYFSQQVYGALLMQGEEVKGAVSAYKAPFLNALEGNINYRQGYDPEEVVQKIAEMTGKTTDEIAALEVCCCNRIAMDKDVRGKGHLAKLAGAVLNQHPEFDDLPSLGDARIIGPVYPLAIAAGYEPITEDAYGNALFYADEFGGFRRFFNLTGDELKREFGETIREARSWQRERIDQDLSLFEPRRVKGVPLLRERFEEESESEDENLFETAEGKKFRVETISSKELDDETLKQITDFFRLMFTNSFDGQYLVYPSVGEPISIQEVFDAEPNEFIPLDRLDAFDPSTYPKHPETGEAAIFWHHPEATFEKFKEKSLTNAHYTIFRDIETGEIAGLMFGHKCSIKEVFSTEEWENPLHYSGTENPENLRDFKAFLNKLNKQLESRGLDALDEESAIYGWNCIATRPDVRGLEHLTKLTKAFFGMIPEEMKQELLIVGETKFGTRPHALFKTAGGMDITGILTESEEVEKGDPIIIVGPLDNAANIFSLSKKEFEVMMKKMLQKR